MPTGAKAAYRISRQSRVVQEGGYRAARIAIIEMVDMDKENSRHRQSARCRFKADVIRRKMDLVCRHTLAWISLPRHAMCSVLPCLLCVQKRGARIAGDFVHTIEGLFMGYQNMDMHPAFSRCAERDLRAIV
jgi:hypothetical protein